MTVAPEGRSPEPERRRYLLEEFLELEDEVFLAESFRRILGRDPDSGSYRFFDDALRAGAMSRTEVLGHLRHAPEGRQRGTRILGLPSRFLLARLTRRFKSPNGASGAYPRPTPVSGAHAAPTSASERQLPGPFTADEADTLRRLGFGPSRPLAHSETAAWSAPRGVSVTTSLRDEEREGLAFATLCTVSHLPAARALLASLHTQHPEATLYLLVVDGDRDVALPCEATVLVATDLQVPRLGFLALKYTALDLCCALKPFLLRHLLEQKRHAKLVYLDSDILVFRRMEELTSRLDSAQFVVTPHLVAPHSDSWRLWERPSLGDLANAGVFNAGMFGLRATPDALRFLDCLCELVTAPGAFHLSGQAEQHSFNWIVAFCDSVSVLRDTSYNVAYWNLHDRSLRDRRLDSADSPAAWTVDGRPLTAFHFSGFSLSQPWRLSKYDERHSTHVLPSVRSMLDHYCEQWRRHCDPRDQAPYRYGRWPSGAPIDDRMRSIFREHELQFDRDVDPWTEEGERYFAGLLMRPMPGSGSLLPILWEEVHRQRPDLQALFSDARTAPRGMLRWAASLGVREYGYERLFDAHRLRSPSTLGARPLLEAISEHGGIPDAGGVPARQPLVEWLASRGENARADEVALLEVERAETTILGMIRRLLDEERPDLRMKFPDLLFSGAAEMTRWLEQEGEPGFLLPEGSARTFGRCSEGRSLARIFSFVNAHWRLGAQFPLAFVGQGRVAFAEMLLRALRTGCQFDIEDVAMYLWVMEEKPSAGLALTLELLPNLGRDPAPWTHAGQEALLGSSLNRPEFVAELQAYRVRHPSPLGGGPPTNGLERRPITVFELMETGGEAPAVACAVRPVVAPRGAEQRTGVNLFGYFRSPIGLGMLTRGVAAAIESAGLPVSPNLLGNVAMDPELSVVDFVRKFEFGYDTNLFCSYPHFDELLIERLPLAMVDGRRNIVYLAWEQRDGMELWRRVYERFDQVWALSDFAARSLARFLGREVITVPCVVDFDSFPQRARKSELGLDEDRVSFLYIFDANSSVERKNPAAVIEAFGRAFAGSDEAELIVKISNASRVENRARLQRLVGGAIQQGSRVRVVARDMSRLDLLRLISAADCYVSLHRAEGFGYTCAEAMAYGKPVIATGYSGNLQYMNEDNSFLAAFREVEVSSPEGPFPRGSVWAEPDVDHAAGLMRRVVEQPGVAASRGERAARDVRAACSVGAVSAVVAEALGLRPARSR